VDESSFRAEGTPEQVLDFVEQVCRNSGMQVETRGATTVGAKRDGLFGSDAFLAAVGENAGDLVLMCRYDGKRGNAAAVAVSSKYRPYEPQAFAAKRGQPITEWPDSATLHQANVSAVIFDAPEDGAYVDVVGESHYQGALLETAEGSTEDGAAVSERTVFLMPEPQNPHDPNAVRVFMMPGGLVGYLSREDAISYRPVIDELARSGQVVACEAEISGGWDRGEDDRGSFGVRLYLGDSESLRQELSELA